MVVLLLLVVAPGAQAAPEATATVTTATAGADGTSIHLIGTAVISNCRGACGTIVLAVRSERHGSCPPGIGIGVEMTTLWSEPGAVEDGVPVNFDVRTYNSLGWFEPCTYVVRREGGPVPVESCLPEFAPDIRRELCATENIGVFNTIAQGPSLTYERQPDERWTACVPFEGRARWENLIEVRHVGCKRAKGVLRSMWGTTIWNTVEHLKARGFRCVYSVGDGTTPSRTDCHRGRQRIREDWL
jgi:hypothetical protein